MASERVDAVVVGARCAGSATATALARAGRRVVVVDRATFPSDTLSTHLLFAGGVAELDTLGARERVEALGPPRLPRALVGALGFEVTTGYTPVGTVDYGLCVRRPGLDAALVETAREAGAEVREGVAATDLVREEGRVAGVRVAGADGERELRAPLVVGADGRRSTVARLVGAERPYRVNPNGRACFFAYFEDSRPEWRATAAQWRQGRDLGTAFPCDGGLVLVLVMPPRTWGQERRSDAQAFFEETLERIPALVERLEGCTQRGKVRSATDLPSFFRRSAGPGWALAGDAGHFKDPVTAQGIRDALRFGRRLGEEAAPRLDDPRALDAALARWELERDRECLETYQWTNLLARDQEVTPLEAELYRTIATRPDRARDFLDVFSRTRRPASVLTIRRSVGLIARALARRGADHPGVLGSAARELGPDARHRIQRARLAATARAPWRARGRARG